MRHDADFMKYLNPSYVVATKDFVGPISDISDASGAKLYPPCLHFIQLLMLPSHAGLYCMKLAHQTTCVKFCTISQFYFHAFSRFLSSHASAVLCCQAGVYTRVRCALEVDEEPSKEPHSHDPLGNIYKVAQPAACCACFVSACYVVCCSRNNTEQEVEKSVKDKIVKKKVCGVGTYYLQPSHL